MAARRLGSILSIGGGFFVEVLRIASAHVLIEWSRSAVKQPGVRKVIGEAAAFYATRPYVVAVAIAVLAIIVVLILTRHEERTAMTAHDAPPNSPPLAISQTMTASPGGIQAGRDVLIGIQRRIVLPDVRSEMVQILRPEAETHIKFSSTQGDPEASAFKSELMSIFSEGGWTVEDRHVFMLVPESKGLKVLVGADVPEAGPARTAVLALRKTENPIGFHRSDMAGQNGILVQVWSAP
jgi:hypothetical protein